MYETGDRGPQSGVRHAKGTLEKHTAVGVVAYATKRVARSELHTCKPNKEESAIIPFEVVSENTAKLLQHVASLHCPFAHSVLDGVL